MNIQYKQEDIQKALKMLDGLPVTGINNCAGVVEIYRILNSGEAVEDTNKSDE